MGSKQTKQGEPADIEQRRSLRKVRKKREDVCNKPLPTIGVFNAEEVAKKLKRDIEACQNNPDVALLNQVKETSEKLKAIAKESNDFVTMASEMSRWAQKKEDRDLINAAIKMASEQRDLSFKTMKVCSTIKTESETWKQFYTAMVMAVKKLKVGNDEASRKILRERAVENFPEVGEILAALDEVTPQWNTHAKALSELSPKFMQLSEKYKKTQKEERKKAFWKWAKLAGYVLAATVLIAGVATLCVVASPLAGGAGALAFGVTVSSSTAAGVGSGMTLGAGAAIAGAFACGSAAAAASKAAYDAGKAASACNSGSNHCSKMAEMSMDIARKLGNSSENIRINITLFCKKLQQIIRDKVKPSNFGLKKYEEPGMSKPTADELCDALKYLLETEQDPDLSEDVEAKLKESVRACKDLGVTVLSLESCLLLLNTDPAQSAHIRKLYEEGVNQTYV